MFMFIQLHKLNLCSLPQYSTCLKTTNHRLFSQIRMMSQLKRFTKNIAYIKMIYFQRLEGYLLISFNLLFTDLRR